MSRPFSLANFLMLPALCAAPLLEACGESGDGLPADPPLPARAVRPWSRSHEMRDLAGEESAVAYAVFVFFLTRIGPLEAPMPHVFFLSVSGRDPADAVMAAIREDPEVKAVFGPRMPAIETYSRWDGKKSFQGLRIDVSSVTIAPEKDLDVAYADGATLTEGLCCEELSFELSRRGDGWVVWNSKVEAIY